MTTGQDWQYAWPVALMLVSAVGAATLAWLAASTWPRFCRHRHSILKRGADGVAGLECVKCGLWVADPRDHRVPWPAQEPRTKLLAKAASVVSENDKVATIDRRST